MPLGFSPNSSFSLFFASISILFTHFIQSIQFRLSIAALVYMVILGNDVFYWCNVVHFMLTVGGYVCWLQFIYMWQFCGVYSFSYSMKTFHTILIITCMRIRSNGAWKCNQFFSMHFIRSSWNNIQYYRI